MSRAQGITLVEKNQRINLGKKLEPSLAQEGHMCCQRHTRAESVPGEQARITGA